MSPLLKKDIQLVCFDVDHTLLNDAQQLTPLTERTLKELQEREIHVILATGKNRDAVLEIIETLDLCDPLIFSNGCLIQTGDGKILCKHTLPLEKSQQVLDFGMRNRVNMMMYCSDRTIEKEGHQSPNLTAKYGGSPPVVVKNWEDLDERLHDVLKILFIDGRNKPFLVELEEKLNHEITEDISTCYSLPFLLEVMPRGVSKGNTLHELSQLINIPLDNMMAFGDGNNDIEMLEFAGVGVALGNATPELKEVADHVTLTNNEDGPALFLRDYFNLP